MSTDGGRDPLDATQEIEFVPDDSGVVSDREFDQDDLLPAVEEEQDQVTSMSASASSGASAAVSATPARSRAAAGARRRAAEDGGGLQEPPVLGADGDGSVAPPGNLGRVAEDPSESGRGIPPPLQLGNPGAAAPASAQDSLWGALRATARSAGFLKVRRAASTIIPRPQPPSTGMPLGTIFKDQLWTRRGSKDFTSRAPPPLPPPHVGGGFLQAMCRARSTLGRQGWE